MDSLLDRFCRYVQVETTAVEETQQYPSSPGQLELGRMLAAELRALGLAGVEHTADGVVFATVPGTVTGAPTIAWLAHLDTSPESSGKNVRPQVVKYGGGDIPLPGDPTKCIRAEDTPELAALVGKTLITTDGTTLLGADDKAGVAIIMTAAAQLMQQRDVPHSPVRVVFTCDEEVGRGTDKLDLAKIGAVVGYTLDGHASGVLEAETFSADLALVKIKGVNIHPGIAYGKMVNAIRLTGAFLERLPKELSPEMTQDRAPFIHPYDMSGGVAEVTLRILLRSFETQDLAAQAELIRQAAAEVQRTYPQAHLDVEVRQQYRNMREYLKGEPRAVRLADRAYHNCGIKPKYESIRGGTDGSRLSEKGLPTPNLSSGQHNIHSPLEFACLEEMETQVGVLVELARLWGAER